MLRLIPADPLGLRDRALLTLLMSTGQRITALLALDVAAIQVQDGATTLHFPGATRALPLHGQAAAVLSAYLAAAGIEAGALFRSSGWPRKDRTKLGEERLTRNGAWRRIRYLARQAGVTPPTSHAFRRKTLTALSRAGLGLEEVRQYAGHRSAETTRAYTETAPLKPARILARLHCPVPPPALRQKLPARAALRRLLTPWLHGNTITVPHDERARVTALLASLNDPNLTLGSRDEEQKPP
jgi:integrase/recombinase XerD